MTVLVSEDTTSMESKSFYNSTVPNDWTTPTFGSVFFFLKTFPFSREELAHDGTQEAIKNIHYGDIHAKFENEILDVADFDLPSIPSGTFIQEGLYLEDSPLLRDGDLVIADASEDYDGLAESIELSNVRENKVVAGLHTFAARDAKKLTADGFRTYSLRHPQVIREFQRIATGTSVFGISKSNLSRVRLALPPLNEQKSIAKLLGLMDEVINKVRRTINQKALQKKYLMQVLLTGKKRLKEFTDEWRTVHISDLAEEVSKRNADNKSLTVLSCTKHDGLVPSLEYFGRQIFSQDLSTYKLVPKGHFAYATNHIEEGSIGYQGTFNEALISPMYTVFKTDNAIDDRFFFALLKSHYCIYEFGARMEGTIDRRGGLRWDAFSVIKVRIPDRPEQKAIANILEIADWEITLLKTKAELFRLQKKWLMQVLLTGKKRLNVVGG